MRGGGVLLVAPASRLAARLGARTYLTSFCRTGVPTSWQYARSYLNGRVVHLRRVELLIAACFILLPRIHHHATVVEGVRVSIASTLSFILFSKTSISHCIVALSLASGYPTKRSTVCPPAAHTIPIAGRSGEDHGIKIAGLRPNLEPILDLNICERQAGEQSRLQKSIQCPR